MYFTSISDRLKEVLGDIYSPTVNIFKVIGIIVLAMLAVKIGSFVIRKLFEKQKNFKHGIDSKRLATISSLLLSVYRYAVYAIAAIAILSDVFELKSVLAAAGIGGIAVGLGAQSLIKDVIAGFFIILEDQFIVGDLITIETMSGTVERMELRVTKIRNCNGDLHTIPNGEIKKVTNHSRGNKAVIVDIPVAYSADLAKVFDIASRVCSAVAGEFTVIVEPPGVLGITELGKGGMNLRITARTLPNEQWEVERRIRQRIKEEFSAEGIAFS